MSTRATDYVIHFPESYIDYDKPWGNRLQVLVTDKHANIVSNFLAVLLVLAGNGLFKLCRRMLENRERLSIKITSGKTPGSYAIVPADSNNSGGDASDQSNDATTEAAGASSGEGDGGSIGMATLSANTTSEAPGYGIQQGHGILARLEDASNEEGISAAQTATNTSNAHAQGTATISGFATPEDFARHRIQKVYDLVIPFNRHNESLLRRIFSLEFWDGVLYQARQKPGELSWHVLVLIIVLGFYICILILGIVGPYPVIGDSTALSRHPKCGLFLTKHGGGSGGWKDKDLRGWYYNEIARESRQYAKLCFDAVNDTSGTHEHDFCSYYYQRKIDYSVYDNQPCPFKMGNDHLCLLGEQSAFLVTTGVWADPFEDPRVLGINSPFKYKFHRSMSCSPLKTSGFVQAYVSPNGTSEFEEGGKWGYQYAYGNNKYGCAYDTPNCTFQWPFFPDQNRPYIMLTTSTSPVSEGPWRPIFALDDTRGFSAHLMLISNFGIHYRQEVLDPVFSANHTPTGILYSRDSLQAGVLACMNRDFLCSYETDPPVCARASGKPPEQFSSGKPLAAWDMMAVSLMFGLESQLEYLRAEALDAQSLLSGQFSTTISNNQWKHEVRQMFETVLARTQIQARDLARGRPGEMPGGMENGIANRSSDFCTQYKFRAIGWKNISVTWLVGEVLGAVLLVGIGLTNEEGKLRIEWLLKVASEGIVKICTDYVPNAGKWLSAKFILVLYEMCDAVVNCYEKVGRKRRWQVP